VASRAPPDRRVRCEVVGTRVLPRAGQESAPQPSTEDPVTALAVHRDPLVSPRDPTPPIPSVQASPGCMRANNRRPWHGHPPPGRARHPLPAHREQHPVGGRRCHCGLTHRARDQNDHTRDQDSHSGRVTRPVARHYSSPSDRPRALPTPVVCGEIVRSRPIDTRWASRLLDTDGKPFGTIGASG
jgi:hypothetical protein